MHDLTGNLPKQLPSANGPPVRWAVSACSRRGADRNRTDEWRFCRPLPYHLATAPRWISRSRPERRKALKLAHVRAVVNALTCPRGGPAADLPLPPERQRVCQTGSLHRTA